jgi:hypothetical protein
VFKATVKRSSPPAVRTSAAFQRLPKASARKPGVSKLAEPDPAPKRQTARAVAPPALDSHKRGPMTMFLLAALLAGAAIAAVVSVRLLGR